MGLDQVLLQLQSRLMAVTTWPAERVLICAPEDLEDMNLQAEAYCLLWGGPEKLNDAVFQGAGRLDARMTSRCFVMLRSRCALDQAGSGVSWLTDPNFGHYAQRAPVLDAVLGFLVTDDGTGQSGDWLTFQYIGGLTCDRPRRNRKDRTWGESTVYFDVSYVLGLNQGYQ